ncbi:MAG: RlmE family RNA methyltransferase [Deferribacteraceae bacterium]|jgi:23S rRNA (uridine2552-2'-O)-methyltransferase|nr:RlmE family RNA methyltransferase [Deferribacteraceae bacterium]
MYSRKDSYYLKAKKEGYKSRAAYKLLELNQKYKFIRKDYKALDLGAAPGGWSQVALELVGTGGSVTAVDMEEIVGINASNFTFIHGNMLDSVIADKLETNASGGYDIIISDMAPKTSGIRIKDHADSIKLAQTAATMADKMLKKGGAFLVKLFDGEDRPAFVDELRKKYKNIHQTRPDATRKNSFEMYIVALSRL